MSTSRKNFKNDLLIVIFIAVFFLLRWIFVSPSFLDFLVEKNRHFFRNLPSFSITGSLAGPITLKNVEFQNDKLDIKIDDAVFDWRPYKLLFFKLDITQFYASKIVVTLKDSSVKESPKTKFKFKDLGQFHDYFQSLQNVLPFWPYLQIKYDLKNIDINNFVLQQNKEKVSIDKFNFELVGNTHNVQKINLSLSKNENTLNIEGTDFHNLDLEWQANLPKINEIYPGIQGKIISNGLISYSRNNFIENTDIQNFIFREVKIGHLSHKMQENFAAEEKTKVNVIDSTLIGQNLQIGDNKLPDLVNRGEVRLSRKNQNWKYVRLKINLAKKEALENPFLTGNITLWENASLQGTLNFNDPHLTLGKYFSGAVKSSLKISGDLDNIKLTCDAKIDKLMVQEPSYGFQATDGTFNFHLAKNSLLFDGQLFNPKNKEENITIKGEGKFADNFSQPKLQIDLKTASFPFVNTEDIKGNGSADLHLALTPKKIDLTGDVHVFHTNVFIEQFNDVNVLPTETVFINEKKDNFLKGLRNHLYLKVKITMQDDVFFKWSALSGNVSGALLFEEDPDNLLNVDGSLMIKNGLFNAYNKDLKVVKGKLTYSKTPIANPQIEFQALREIQSFGFNSTTGNKNMYVGVELIGTPQNNKIRLFSIPDNNLSHNDLVAYLITGMSADDLGSDQLAVLLNTIMIASGSGSWNVIGLVSNKLKSSLKIDDISISANNSVSSRLNGENKNEGSSNTMLSIGKYLTKNLYFDYSVGILTGLNIFRFKYHLYKNFFLQAEHSSFENGIDLLYSFSRD